MESLENESGCQIVERMFDKSGHGERAIPLSCALLPTIVRNTGD